MLCQPFGRKAWQWLAQVSGCTWACSGEPLPHLLPEDRDWGQQDLGQSFFPQLQCLTQGIHSPWGVELGPRSEGWNRIAQH